MRSAMPENIFLEDVFSRRLASRFCLCKMSPGSDNRQNQPRPLMFITCSCDHCAQHIEFSTDDFVESTRTETAILGQPVSCPGCEKKTRLVIPQTPPRHVMPKSLSRLPWKLIIIGILAIFAISAAVVFIRIVGVEQTASTMGLTVGALIYAFVGVCVFLLAVFWLLFPVLMYVQLKRSNELLEIVERNTRQSAASAEKASRQRDEGSPVRPKLTS